MPRGQDLLLKGGDQPLRLRKELFIWRKEDGVMRPLPAGPRPSGLDISCSAFCLRPHGMLRCQQPPQGEAVSLVCDRRLRTNGAC